MNLGDGLLFELNNGKPRLILLSHGPEKNPAKQTSRPRAAAHVLSCRQPTCAEEAQGEARPARQQAGRRGEARSKAGGAGSHAVTSSKTQEHHRGGGVRAVVKVKSDKHKHASTAGSPRANGKPGQGSGSRPGGRAGPTDTVTRGDTGPMDGAAVLTGEQLQRILDTVRTSGEDGGAAEGHGTQEQTGSKPGNPVNEGGGGGVEEDGGGVTITTATSQDKDNRSSRCLFSWMEERETHNREAADARRAQWRRELDEQVALKQRQRSDPVGLQPEEDAHSVSSLQSSVSHRLRPTADVDGREEQRRRWLEELDRQREETGERRRREKLLRSQAEDHELWAAHFDSLQRRPAPPPPPPASSSERGEWEPSSSLSQVWEAESVGGASVDTSCGYPSRASYLRTMTSLLDPSQIEERERRRLKQLEQQRAIKVQMEERRLQREQEEARRREEEEQEERRVALERETLQRRYELDTQRERQKLNQEVEQQGGSVHAEGAQETQSRRSEELSSSVSPYRDIAVQTETERVQTPPPPPPPSSAPPPNSRSRAGKENICQSGGGGGGAGDDVYEAFARTERSRREKRRPEWNTQRPGRRFVPASERYPAALQRNRRESRQRRQAELLALQERACSSRADPTRTGPDSKVGGAPTAPPPPPPPPQLEFVPYVRTNDVFNLEPVVSPPPSTCTVSPPAPPPPPRDPLLHPDRLRAMHTHRQQEILRGLAQLRQGLLLKQRELESDLDPPPRRT